MDRYVFTPVCDSVHWGGGVHPPEQTPLSRHPLGKHPQADTPLGGHPPRQANTPSRQTAPPEMATAADGTHPTGMHSCFRLNW